MSGRARLTYSQRQLNESLDANGDFDILADRHQRSSESDASLHAASLSLSGALLRPSVDLPRHRP
jgi:hypothetical protein